MAATASEADYVFKVLARGAVGVGKTSLILRFVADKWYDESESTIAAAFTKRVLVTADGTPVELQMWDVAGCGFESNTPMLYRGSDAVLLCYDTVHRDSFRSIRASTLHPLARLAPDDAVLMLVGTKTDLESPDQAKGRTPMTYLPPLPPTTPGGKVEEEKEWDEQRDAALLAAELGVVLRRCSAKTKEGVEELFADLAELLLARVRGGTAGSAKHRAIMQTVREASAVSLRKEKEEAAAGRTCWQSL